MGRLGTTELDYQIPKHNQCGRCLSPCPCLPPSSTDVTSAASLTVALVPPGGINAVALTERRHVSSIGVSAWSESSHVCCDRVHVVWIRMVHTGFYVWMLYSQLLELFQKDLKASHCWSRCVTGSRLWGFKSPHQVQCVCLLPVGQGVKLWATSLTPCLPFMAPRSLSWWSWNNSLKPQLNDVICKSCLGSQCLFIATEQWLRLSAGEGTRP